MGMTEAELVAMLNAVYIAPRSRTGRRWKPTGRVLHGKVLLWPVADDGFGEWCVGGGVKPLWRTPAELADWTVVGVSAR